MLPGQLKRGLKALVALTVVGMLTLVSVSASAGSAEASSKKSPKMYAVSAFPTIYKEDGTLVQPTDARNHWYIDVWDSSNKLTVKVDKKAKGKVCLWTSVFGSKFSKTSCKTVKKGVVSFKSDPDPTSFDIYDRSDSILCDESLPGYSAFGCDASLDAKMNDFFEAKFKLVFTPSNKKFKKQTVYLTSTLFLNLTLNGDYRP